MNYHKVTEDILTCIKRIPYGKVTTYGSIAASIGHPRGARQVSRVLASLSEKESLPWHRVVNAEWRISLKGDGARIQLQLLRDEGIIFENQRVAHGHRWTP